MESWRNGLEAHALSGLASRELGRECLRAQTLTSTSDSLWDWAMAGAPHGATILAEHQTAGRGRQGRVWEGPVGNLYFSVLLHPRIPLAQVASFPLVAGLVLARFVETLDLSPRIKWPNDLLLDGLKVAGILVESRPAPRPTLILGIGLNLRTPTGGWPEELSDRAVALDAFGPTLSAEEVAVALLGGLEPAWEEYEAGGLDPFLPALQERDALRGELIRLDNSGREIVGLGQGIGPDGALILKFDDGRIESLHAGEVHLHRPEATS